MATHAEVYDYPSGDPHLVPEALLISALIEEGSYTPSRYGIEDEWFIAHRNIHRFCVDYAAGRNRAPTRELIERKFGKQFCYTEDVDADWAARLVRQAWVSRQARKGIAEALHELSGDEPDVEKAVTLLAQTARDTSVIHRRNPVSIHDDEDDSALEQEAIPLDPPVNDRVFGAKTLTTLTGGIRPGQLMYVAARLGVGKSWRLCQMALSAAQHGTRVSYYSLEMPSGQIKSRLRHLISRNGLTLDEWKERYDGTIDIYDPSITGPLSAATVSANHSPGGLAIIDYIGLMRSSNGARAIDDWRNAASISNQLKEIAIEGSIPVISAAQVNREGARASSGPKTEHVAQSDALGQDADMMLIITEHSTGSHMNTLAKNRHGVHGQKWFSRFDPDSGDFGFLTAEQANDLKARLDEDAEQ